ncbi:MAG: invasin domain 3-containing protein [Leptospirillia bacterium]
MRLICTLRNSRGFTLIELLIGTAIAMMVVAGIFGLYINFVRSSVDQDQILVMQQNARLAISDLERDLRLAGVDVIRDDAVLSDQAVFAYASPYEVVFNANLDDALGGMRPDKAPDTVPSALAPGDTPFYDPFETYAYAETVRWTLDADGDGDIDANDRQDTDNPALYRLTRQIYGYNATLGTNGPETATAAEGIRGPDPYPDGSRPLVLFEYWIQEIDLNDDNTIDPGEDINGNGTIDLFLWGDDGGTAGTGSPLASNGLLDPPEIDALMTGNGGKPKVIDSFNSFVTSTTGDARATALTRAQVLGNINRTTINLTAETPKASANYASSPHGASYPYREKIVTATVTPRNKLTDITSDLSLSVTASPAGVPCPTTSTQLTIQLLNADATPYTSPANVVVTTSLGSFSSSTPVTSKTIALSSGVVVIPLYGDSSVTATSATIKATTTVLTKEYIGSTIVTFLPGPPASITVTPGASSLPADGVSTADVTATLIDACGKPAASTGNINWSVSTNPPGIGGIPSPAQTPISNGLSTTTLTSGTAAGVATITAVESGSGASGSGPVTFTNCMLSIFPASGTLPADGTSSTPVAVQLTDMSGVPQAGVDITLATTDGAITPTLDTTDGSGMVSAILVSSTSPHTATLSGHVPDTGEFCALTFATATVDFNDCGTQLTSNVAEVIPGGTAQITATVTDSTTSSGISGQQVSFSLSAPDGSVSPASATTNGSGLATATFTAGATGALATISGASGCGTGTVDILVRDCLVSMQASPPSISPVGGETSTITATLTDTVTGQPLVGRSVSFSLDDASLAKFVGVTSPLTDLNGVASVTLTTVGPTGTVNVTATSDCGSSSLPVVISDWALSLSAAGSSLAQGKAMPLTVTLTSGGSPADPPAGSDVVTLTFDAPGALGSTVSPGTDTTSGGVTNHTFTAGATSGTVRVRASATVSGVTISDTIDLLITDPSSANDLALEIGSESVCGKNNDKVGFQVKNRGLDDLRITSIQVAWTAGGKLDKVKTEGSTTDCKGGSELWKASGCGSPDGQLGSPAVLTTFCKNIVLNQGQTYTFNEVKVKDTDMRGDTVTLIITHEPVGGGTAKTSTITILVPSI